MILKLLKSELTLGIAYFISVKESETDNTKKAK